MAGGSGRHPPGDGVAAYSADRNAAERFTQEAPVDIEIAIQAEDLGDIQPLRERHQGEISEIAGQIGIALVELHHASVILQKQVDQLDPTAADGPKQMVLSGQADAGITGITQQLEHLGDVDRCGDQLRGGLIKESHDLLMEGLLLLAAVGTGMHAQNACCTGNLEQELVQEARPGSTGAGAQVVQ